jgi:hypothetical protein
MAISGLAQMADSRLFEKHVHRQGLSRTNLTHQIAGLAMQQKSRLSTTNGSLCLYSSHSYFAGLFRTNFIHQLLWRAMHHEGCFIQFSGPTGTVQQRPSPYRAPSWSWASIDTRIWYGFTIRHKAEYHVTINQTESFFIPAAANHPKGPILASSLVLTGPVVPVRLVLGKKKENSCEGVLKSVVQNSLGYSASIAIDLMREPNLEESDHGYNCLILEDCPNKDHYVKKATCSECEINLEEGWYERPKFCCLRIMTSDDEKYDGQVVNYFLVLERLETEDHTWERIGTGSVVYDKRRRLGRKVPVKDKDGEYLFFKGARVEKLRII